MDPLPEPSCLGIPVTRYDQDTGVRRDRHWDLGSGAPGYQAGSRGGWVIRRKPERRPSSPVAAGSFRHTCRVLRRGRRQPGVGRRARRRLVSVVRQKVRLLDSHRRSGLPSSTTRIDERSYGWYSRESWFFVLGTSNFLLYV
jgi:hypothetical protein